MVILLMILQIQHSFKIMKKIAASITINQNVQTGQVTYDVLDEEGTVLDSGQYEDEEGLIEEVTVQDILNVTGIQFGLSSYIVS